MRSDYIIGADQRKWAEADAAADASPLEVTLEAGSLRGAIILRYMSFRPPVAFDLKLMDKRLFSPAPMNLRAGMDAKARANPQAAS